MPFVGGLDGPLDLARAMQYVQCLGKAQREGVQYLQFRMPGVPAGLHGACGEPVVLVVW